MKLIITTLAVAAVMLLAPVLPAYAGNGGAPVAGCQPGSNNQIVESWQMLSLEEYAALLVEEGSAPNYESAVERATVTYNFCDHNGDNYACVMEQNLPNDSSHWFLIEDNHLFGGN